MSSIDIQQSASNESTLSSINLPRLLYVGDVAIESTVSGSAILYRLLQKYPADHLCIVEGSIWKSGAANRLPNVRYDIFHSGSHRLLHTRFAHYYATYLFCTARSRLKELSSLSKDFKPEAILSVTHGFSWIAAGLLASH